MILPTGTLPALPWVLPVQAVPHMHGRKAAIRNPEHSVLPAVRMQRMIFQIPVAPPLQAILLSGGQRAVVTAGGATTAQGPLTADKKDPQKALVS